MHWARWGDPAEAAPLPEAARGLVELAFGPAQDRTAAAPLDRRPARRSRSRAPTCSPRCAASSAPDHVRTDHESRVRHTRGKSTPDLLRMRAGDGTDAPDAVVRPADHDEVAALVGWCGEHRVALVPFGGGTSVVGGLAARTATATPASSPSTCAGSTGSSRSTPSPAPPRSSAGLLGPAAEALLAEHGLTLGHFPQSFEYASIGGFAATRSSGQASSGYGRFDALVLGLTVATPARHARPRAARPPAPPAPTCASWCSAPRARSA